MRTVAITAGVHYWYPEAAKCFAERWNRLAGYVDDGFECIDLSNVLPWKDMVDHCFCKYHVWDVIPEDVERIIWVDCDCFQTRPVRLGELPDARFSAVPDAEQSQEKMRAGWPPAADVVRFFNAGVFMCTRELRPMFDVMKAIDQDLSATRDYGDQSWINLHVARTYKDFNTNPTGWYDLGNEWNSLPDKEQPSRPILVHLAGVWNRWNYLKLMYGAWDEIERFVRAVGPRPVPSAASGSA